MSSANTDAIRRYVEGAKGILMWDEPSATLLDVFSGKSFTLPTGGVAEIAERATTEGKEPYLLIVLGDGRQLALTQAGLGFSPDLQNSGPLPGIPQVVCFRDFDGVMKQVEHFIGFHKDEPAGREILDCLMYGIAVVDGARAMGFEISRDERRLERALSAIESQRT